MTDHSQWFLTLRLTYLEGTLGLLGIGGLPDTIPMMSPAIDAWSVAVVTDGRDAADGNLPFCFFGGKHPTCL